MRWSDIPFTPPPQTLRRFGATGLVVLSALAGWQFFQERAILAGILLGLALVLGGVGLVYPGALRPVFVGMMVLGFPVNWLVSHVMLALIFYCLFTPVAVLFRLVGRDILGRRFRRGEDTYWVAKPRPEGVRSYFRQS